MKTSGRLYQGLAQRKVRIQRPQEENCATDQPQYIKRFIPLSLTYSNLQLCSVSVTSGKEVKGEEQQKLKMD